MKDEFMHATGSYTAQDPSLTLVFRGSWASRTHGKP